MFAMKSMDKASALLKLKLDLVYRDLAIEAAQTRFDELNVVEAAPEAAPAMAVVDVPKAAPKKKVIKALVPAGVPGAAPAKRVVSDAVRAAASERMKKRWADTKALADAARVPPKAVLPAAK
jgi:hypothetical protein